MKIGDRLRIGPVELEIIECNQPPAEQQPVFHPAHEPSEETGELQLKLDESLLQIKRLQAESRQAFQSSITAAERADQLRDALALANDQLEEMYKELAASEQTIDKATTDLEECRRQLAELNACDKQSGVAKEDTRQAVVAAMKECERLNAELTDAIGAANKERESWNKERESWNIERAELQRLIAQQAAELESARSSNVAQTCALTVSLTEKTSENEAAQKQLQAKITDLEEQLTAQQCEIDSLRRQLDEKSAEGSAMTVAFHERSKGDEAARNELQAKLKELEQQLGGKQCEVESLQQQLDEKSAEGSAMTIAFHERSKGDEAARSELQAKLKDLEQQLGARQREVESLKQQLDEKAAEGSAMTIAFHERSKGDDAAHNELQAKLKNLEQQLGGKQREVESLQQQLDEKSAEGCAMTISLGARSQDDAAARKELETKLAGLEEQLATKQRELDSLQQRLDEEAAQGCAMTIALGERSRVGDTGRKEFEAKLTDLEERLTEKQGEIDTLQQRLESHAGVQHKLERLAVEFDSKCRELEDARGQLAAAGEKNATVQQELDQQTEALLVREQELLKHEAAIADLEKGRAAEHDESHSERERLQDQKIGQQQAQLDGRAAELEAMSAQVVSRQVELDELRKQLTAEHASIEEQRRKLDQQRQELESQQQVLRAQQEALEQRMADERQMAASPQVPEQPAAPGTATGGAASADAGEAGGVDSVLSRLVKAGLWRGDEPGATADAESSAGPRQIPEPVAERPIPPTRPAEGLQMPADADGFAPHPSTDALAPLSTTPGKAGSDEESIESYMERLMQRMRGDEGAQKAAGTPPVAPIAASPTSGAGETAANPPTAGEELPIAAEPGEFTPRRAAPEVIADMSAMRDIANTAARSAIDRHVRKHTGQQAAGRLLGACLTVALSTGLGFWAWKTGSLQAAAGSIIGGGLGLHWLLYAARRLFKLRHLNALQNPPAEAVTKPN